MPILYYIVRDCGNSSDIDRLRQWTTVRILLYSQSSLASLFSASALVPSILLALFQVA